MNNLIKVLNQIVPDKDGEKIAQVLNLYMEDILEWNTKVNLTSITDPIEFEQKHYIDSLLCAEREEFLKSKTIIDIGTGGGFPGIPLAVAFPEKEFVLVDSLRKRLNIIDEICLKLNIKNVKTVHGRAEELGRNKAYRDKFDMCVSRAVANLSTLSEYCLPFVKPNGYFISYKGPSGREEVEKAQKAIKLLKGEVKEIYEPVNQGNINEESLSHSLVIIKKLEKTPAKYPRKPGTPAKEPL